MSDPTTDPTPGPTPHTHAAATAPPKRPRRRLAFLALGAAGVGLAGMGVVHATSADRAGWERDGWERGERGWGERGWGERGWGHHGWREGRGEGRGEGYRMHRRDRERRMARFCAFETARYAPVARAWVKADLRLDANQATQFDAFADLVMPGLETLKQEVCADLRSPPAAAPDKLRELSDNLRRAADLAEKALPQAQQFYASLDDGQKARVDQFLERRTGRGFGPRPDRRGPPPAEGPAPRMDTPPRP